MKNQIQLKFLLGSNDKTVEEQLALFALLNLGVLESLTTGLISATDANTIFFNAENCLFVRQQLHSKGADEIMSYGVQLSNLFDVLPQAQAQREFQRELNTMRSLSLTLLEEKQLAA